MSFSSFSFFHSITDSAKEIWIYRQSESNVVEIAASTDVDDTIQSLRSLSVAEGEIVREDSGDLPLEYNRVRLVSRDIQLLAPSTSSGDASSQSSFTPEANIEWDVISRRSLSVGSRFSTCSSSELTDPVKTPQDPTESSEIEFEPPMYLESSGDLFHSVSSSTAVSSLLWQIWNFCSPNNFWMNHEHIWSSRNKVWTMSSLKSLPNL